MYVIHHLLLLWNDKLYESRQVMNRWRKIKQLLERLTLDVSAVLAIPGLLLSRLDRQARI